MKTLLMSLMLVFPSAQALGLPELLRALPAHHPEVLKAAQDLKQAQTDFQQTALDPDALALDRLKTSHRQDLLDVSLQNTLLAAQKSVTEQYWSLFIKTRTVQEAPWRQKLSETRLNIARTRKATGAGTQQEVLQAEQDLRTLNSDLEQTRLEVQQLCSQLSQQTGLKIQPDTALTEPETLHAMPTFKTQIELRKDVLEARQAVKEAELQLRLIDPVFNSRKEQEERQGALDRSKTTLVSTETAARRDIQKAQDDLKSALSQLSLSAQQLKTSEAQFAKDQQKFQQGILAQIKLLDSEASLKDARRKLLEAKQNVATAHLNLMVTLGQTLGDGASQEKAR